MVQKKMAAGKPAAKGLRQTTAPVTKKTAIAKPATSAAKVGDAIWDQKKVKDFVQGKITLGELQGISKKTQYKIAEMGYGLCSQGKYVEADKLFAGLVALDPRDPYFLLARGSVAQKQDNLAEADRWYSEALRHAPSHAVALANRGEVRMELGRLQEGAVDLIAALKHDPDLKEPTSRRARALLVGLKTTLDEGAAARKPATARKVR
ncbi:MAG: tetratricopeptide repeat protein [Deltaproteobacteria bacterium]|nr:tetratricopeptide repeat protein [Deltaproteobacteria bacterium]